MDGIAGGLKHRDKTLQVVWCFHDSDRTFYAPVRAGKMLARCAKSARMANKRSKKLPGAGLLDHAIMRSPKLPPGFPNCDGRK